MFDTFFSDLELERENHLAEKVSFGSKMKALHWEKRWAYVGSMTIPPCKQYVYWNVLKTVYPIKQAQLDLVRNKLKKGGLDTEGDRYAGNWREI